MRYGASGMQGWRKRMEDSHISELSAGNGKASIFGVFDGHGGKEVAVYVKRHYVDELTNLSSFKQGNIKNAAIESFLRIDELLVTPEGRQELKIESKLSKEDDEKNTVKNQQMSQMDMYRQMFDPKAKEDCEIALYTGCTACVCILYEDKFYFANAGDSRAVLCKNGVAYPMSIDHKPELETERTRIYKADGYIQDGRIKGI
jgi:protein phosphatase 1G